MRLGWGWLGEDRVERVVLPMRVFVRVRVWRERVEGDFRRVVRPLSVTNRHYSSTN